MSDRERDLDDTRRLLYIAHMAPLVPRRKGCATLAGTLVNALVHHGTGLSLDEARRRVADCLADQPTETATEWLLERVDELTARLADLGDEGP